MSPRARIRLAVGAAVLLVVLGAVGAWLLGGRRGGGGPAPGAAEAPAHPVAPAPDPGEAPAPDARHAGTGTLLVRVRSETVAAVPATLSLESPAGEVGDPAPSVSGAGDLRLAGIPAERSWAVVVAAPGHRARRLPAVVLGPGEVRDLGEVVLERSFPLVGRVVDPFGAPVPGARVGTLRGPGSTATLDVRPFVDGFFRGLAWAGEAASGPDGAFALDVPGEGTWTVVAWKEGFAPGRRDGILIQEGGTALPVEVRLDPGHALRVVVADAAGEPLEGAAVAGLLGFGRSQLPTDGAVPSRTGPDGAVLLRGLPPGYVSLAVRTADGRTALHAVQVPLVSEVLLRVGGTASLIVRVRDGTGTALAGASVTAILRARESGSVQILRASADAAGVASWEGLDAGRVLLLAGEKEGFATGIPRNDLLPFRPPGDPLDLLPGEVAEAEIVLGAGSVVRGRVTHALDGTPAPGAEVHLVQPGRVYLGSVQSTMADGSGAYRFDAVPAGPALIVATTPDALSPFQPRGLFGEARTTPPGIVYIPEGPADVVRDLLLQEAGEVSGRVIGPDGGPVPGAAVTVEGPGMGDTLVVLDLPGLGAPSVLADGQGRFRVRGVRPSAAARARASAEGLLPGAAPPFRVGPGETVEEVVIRLAAGGALEGRVSSPDGAPVAGAEVQAVPASPAADGASPSTARTAVDGSFRIGAVPPGTWAVVARARGFRDGSAGGLVVTGGAPARADLSLEPGRLLAGTVMDADRHPLQGVRVELTPVGDWQPPPGTPRTFTAFSDGTGAFRFATLPEGNWTLRARLAGYPSATLSSVVSGSSRVEVAFPRAMAIAGRVTDAGGDPVEGARVRARPEDPDAEGGIARTGADGRFRIFPLAPGSYGVTVPPPSREFWGTVVEGVAAGDEEVAIVLEMAMEIRGRVLGPGGAAPAAGSLEVAPLEGGPARSVGDWSGDGAFVIRVPPGRYEVRAATTAGPPALGTVVAEAGEVDVEVLLRAR